MLDPRIEKLAENLVHYSISLKKGEKVLIDAYDVPDEMVKALIGEVRRRKGVPFVSVKHAAITREMLLGLTEEQITLQAKLELNRMKEMDAYIALRGSFNIFENADVPSKKMRLYMKKMLPVQDQRVEKSKWVVLRWPTPSMAQQALTSTERFEDFFFRTCCMDYSRMVSGAKALKRLMDRTDKVEIKGPGTDLQFSIKGLQAITATGDRNIPDGEVFTAPVKTSVEGCLSYNVPTIRDGVGFDNIRFEFEKGKIVKATCSGQNRRLNAILDSDPGARYIGEFALGFNPYILEPMRDTLFDEKISGSFHFTPGKAYKGVADNGNHSQVHWDIVSIQRKDYGGGEIWFDGKLVRKDGLFVPKSLQKLNPEYLIAEGD